MPSTNITKKNIAHFTAFYVQCKFQKIYNNLEKYVC